METVLPGAHTHTHTHEWEHINIFLIRGELRGCVCKKQNRPLSACCEHTRRHTHSTNQVSQAGKVLTGFYRGVDALPSIPGLSLSLMLSFAHAPSLSIFLPFRGGDAWEDVWLITAFS